MLYNLSNGSAAQPIYNEQLDFGEYLNQTREQAFVLNLSDKSILEIIDALVSIRVKVHPKYRNHLTTLIKHLGLIQQQFKCTINPQQVTDVFWIYFIQFMKEHRLANSTISEVCSQLKYVLTWAAKYGAKLSPTFDVVELPKGSTQKIALSADDVSRITYFDISTINRRPQHLRELARVRDMFVLSCNLGQRFSDMVRIDETNFNRNIFTIVQQKTGNKAHLDINKMSLDKKTVYRILQKYNYKAPYQHDLSNYDKYVRELMHYVGFNETIVNEERIDGFIQKEEMIKADMIRSHTARRTFITYNITRGLSSEEVMRASGHKSYSSFQKYLCYEDD